MQRLAVLITVLVFCAIAEHSVLFAGEKDRKKRSNIDNFEERILGGNRRSAKQELDLFAQRIERYGTNLSPEILEQARKSEQFFRHQGIANFKSLDELLGIDGRRGAEFFLQERVVGQPEAVEAFLEIERRVKIQGRGRRTAPEIVYLMGLPGTGKDYVTNLYAQLIKSTSDRESNIYDMPVAKSKADLWNEFGSATGYVGSEKEISGFLRFLVNHSGGRYFIKTSSTGKQTVHENPKWSPDVLIPSAPQPEDAIVKVNGFHNWAIDAKDDFFINGFEKGRFPINAHGDGLNHIIVPVTFAVASNDGIELLTNRDHFGRRIGQSLTFEQIMQRHERLVKNKSRLIDAMKKRRLATVGRDTQGGISEELANRIPLDRIVVMRPQSIESLERIVSFMLAELETEYRRARGELGLLRVTFDQNLSTYLAAYDYDAEAGARSVESRIKSQIVAPLDALLLEKIDPSPNGSDIEVNVVEQANGTAKLAIKYRSSSSESWKHAETPIGSTLSRQSLGKLEDDDVDRISSIAAAINKRIFGLEHVAERLQQSVLVGAEATRASRDEGGTAQVFFFLGPSSTGKTETAKVLADEMGLSLTPRNIFDFTKINSAQDMREAIFGKNDVYGVPQSSRFMDEFDANDGKVLFVFDEIANAPREVLNLLYDMFREPVVGGFIDGEVRSMRDVIIIGTGNAGQEEYVGVPRSIPKFMQMLAMEDIYKQFMRDSGRRRIVAERFFSEPLLNRIGEQNIFFFPHLSFLAIRRLAEAKLDAALNSLVETENGRGWNISFASPEDRIAFIDMIESDGFVIREQGASVNGFVKVWIKEALKAELLKRHVSDGTNVMLRFNSRIHDDQLNMNVITWKVDAGDQEFDLVITGSQDTELLPSSEVSRIITAYHEIGHELVRQALAPDKFKSRIVSVVPGATMIGDQWEVFQGIAIHDELEYMEPTRASIIERLAVFLAGEVAEEIVSGQYTGGKANDIERATQLAMTAVVRMGLSSKWGNYAKLPQSALGDFFAGLSEDRRKLLDREVAQLMSAGRRLARATILQNYQSHFVPMSKELARVGEMDAKALQAYYDKRAPVKPRTYSRFVECVQSCLSLAGARHWLSSIFLPPSTREPRLISQSLRPESVVDIAKLIEERRKKALMHSYSASCERSLED